jgi:hypothetical protein
MLQRNWGKEQNFGFYVINEYTVFAGEMIFDCFPGFGCVETRN